MAQQPFDMKEFMKTQMITMGMMKEDDNNSFFMIIFGLILMQIVEFVTNCIPVLFDAAKGYINRQIELRQEELKTKVFTTEEKVKSSVVFNVITGDISDVAQAMIHYMCNQNSTLPSACASPRTTSRTTTKPSNSITRTWSARSNESTTTKREAWKPWCSKCTPTALR